MTEELKKAKELLKLALDQLKRTDEYSEVDKPGVVKKISEFLNKQ